MPDWTDRPRRVAGVVALALALIFVAAAPALAAEPEAVRVRFGRHAEFVRIVFDWPADVAYKVELEPAGAVVRFAAPNGFDLSRLAGQPGLIANQVDGGVARLAYDGARSLKHFRHGTSVVVDLYETGAGRPLPGAAAPPAEAKQVAADKTAPAPRPAKTETPPPPPPAEPVKTETAKAEPPPPAAAPPSEPTEASPAVAAAAPEASGPQAAPSANTAPAEPKPEATPSEPKGGLPSAAKLAAGAEVDPAPTTAAANEPPADADAAQAQETPAAPAAGPPDLASIPPEGLAAVASPRIQSGRNVAIPLWVEVDKAKVTLGLASTDARAAAFTRAGAHWIVLDRPMPIDIGIAVASGIDIVQLPFNDKTVLHIRVKDRTAFSATRDARGWRFMLGAAPDPTEGAAPIGVLRRHAAEIGKRLALEDLPDSKLLQVIDPEVGDALFVVTVADPRRIRAVVDLPDLRLPETALGAVVEPKTEGIGARLNGARLELRKRGGLILSNPDRILLSSTEARASDIDPRAWRGEESYQAGLRARLAKVNGVAEFGRNSARMDLARFLLARGLATEALGFLQVVAQSDKGAAEKKEFRAMRGIARAMLGQHDLAAQDLDDPGLSGDPHVEIWRAVGLVEAGQARFASAKFRRFQDAIAAWPERHRVMLTVAAGEASLAAGLPAVAERFIQVDITPGHRLRKDQLAALAVVDAGVKAGRGETEAAEESLKVAKRDGDPATQAKAELALVRLGYAEGKLDADTATDRLARLQLRWRGDRVEYDTLRALGEIQLANSRYREGFRALSEAAHVFSTRFDTTDVRAAMTAGFERAFVGEEAEKMPAFEAVALFQDYEDLAPPGSTGDMALANLARRLASLDLLEEADEIMDHLVRRRLDGSKRAAMAGDLAALRLSQRDWKGALQAIGQIDVETLSRYDPSRLRLSRLEAEALGGQGQIDRAMALLDGLDDRDALELKARMAWDNADWISARAAYRELDALGVFNGEKLPAPAAAMAARWAVTATMMKNPPEVQALAERFKDRIEDPALAAALDALAAPDSVDGEALDAAREAIANADTVGKAFDAYRSARSS